MTGRILFVHAFEGAQKISDIGPHSLYRITMNFADPIAHIVAGGFMEPMFDRDM